MGQRVFKVSGAVRVMRASAGPRGEDMRAELLRRVLEAGLPARETQRLSDAVLRGTIGNIDALDANVAVLRSHRAAPRMPGIEIGGTEARAQAERPRILSSGQPAMPGVAVGGPKPLRVHLGATGAPRMPGIRVGA